MKKLLLIALFCLQICSPAQVVISTPPKFRSFLTDGANNAFGCVWTYVSNTTTPLASYTDYTEGTQNANPVILDAGGSADIWLLTGQIYTLVIKTAGGTNCASGTTLSTTNGMNQSLLNLSNTWQQPQIFDDAISILAPDLQIVFGSPSGTQTTLDIPPTAANYILHGPPITGNDTLLSQAAVQTVQNKNLTSGNQINGCGLINGPATYLCIANNASTATVLNSLAILTGAPSTATVAPITATSGVVGIVVSIAGIAGNAVIQQNGKPSCNFDGATTANDFVQISSTVAGDCHDTGSSTLSPLSGQVLGTVLSTNVGAGLYQMNFSPSSTGGSGGVFKYTAPAATTSGTGQTLFAMTIPAGVARTGSLITVNGNITSVTGTPLYCINLNGTLVSGACTSWHIYGFPPISILMTSPTAAVVYQAGYDLTGPPVILANATSTVTDVTANPLVITITQSGTTSIVGDFAWTLVYP